MTVRELLELLHTYNLDSKVRIFEPETMFEFDIQDVNSVNKYEEGIYDETVYLKINSSSGYHSDKDVLDQFPE